jgi:hypothetical protein
VEEREERLVRLASSLRAQNAGNHEEQVQDILDQLSVDDIVALVGHRRTLAAVLYLRRWSADFERGSAASQEDGRRIVQALNANLLMEDFDLLVTNQRNSFVSYLRFSEEAAAADERAAAAEAEAAAAKQTPFQLACIPRKIFERHDSNRTSQSAHQAVNWLEVHLDLPQQPWTLDRFAGAHFTPAYLSTRKPISSEADFARLAYFLLDDMLKGAELHEKMELSSEASLLDTTTNSLRRSDLYVLRMAADSHYSSRPVGAVEVRRHSVDVLNDAQCLGQVRNYLMVLKNQCGVRHPLGFLTSFFSWRACWLPEDEEFAKTTDLASLASAPTGEPSVPISLVACLVPDESGVLCIPVPPELDSESPSHSSSLAQEGSPDSAHPSTLAEDGSPSRLWRGASDSSSNSPVGPIGAVGVRVVQHATVDQDHGASRHLQGYKSLKLCFVVAVVVVMDVVTAAAAGQRRWRSAGRRRRARRRGGSACAAGPRCEPGSANRQPFETVASSRGSQKPVHDSGAVAMNDESWCTSTRPPMRGGLRISIDCTTVGAATPAHGVQQLRHDRPRAQLAHHGAPAVARGVQRVPDLVDRCAPDLGRAASVLFKKNRTVSPEPRKYSSVVRVWSAPVLNTLPEPQASQHLAALAPCPATGRARHPTRRTWRDRTGRERPQIPFPQTRLVKKRSAPHPIIPSCFLFLLKKNN